MIKSWTFLQGQAAQPKGASPELASTSRLAWWIGMDGSVGGLVVRIALTWNDMEKVVVVFLVVFFVTSGVEIDVVVVDAKTMNGSCLTS